MFQRKLIVILGLVALVALSAGVSQASLSRVEGMNLAVPALSQFTDDYVNIYYYPTSVVRQNNLVLAEVGRNPNSDGDLFGGTPLDQTFTVVRNFPRFGAIAFQMKQRALNSSATVANNLNNEQLDIIWGRAFTKVDFAVRLDITNSKAEVSAATGGATPVVTKILQEGLDFGATIPFGAYGPDNIVGTGVEVNTWGLTPALTIHMQNDDRVEGAVTYRRYTMNRTDQTGAAAATTFEDAGNASYAVIARGVFNRGEGKHVWYPAFWYVNDDLGYDVKNSGLTPTNAGVDETYKTYGVGISDNMKVNDNNLLIWGVAAWQTKHQYDRTDANTGGSVFSLKSEEVKVTQAPVVFAALETDATKWLKVRMGASRALMNTRSKATDFETPNAATTDFKTRTSDFTFNLGTGIRWNNLDVDMTLNQKFPLTGGYILSGDQSTPFTRVSATYHF